MRAGSPAARRPGRLAEVVARLGGVPRSALRSVRPHDARLPRPSARMRRIALALLVLLLVTGGVYRFWLRDSSLVSVEHVTVTGVTTKDANRVRAALAATARTMTTLHVRRDRLDQAVAGFPVVRALQVTTDFPHGMKIQVIERVPAAMAVTDSGRVPVAADGTVLQGLPTPGPLPTVRARGGLKGQRLSDPLALAGARVAGTAPPALRRRLDEVHRDGERGLVATMHDGPDLVFGGASRLREKWIAAARVLADQDAQGATYVDLRVPGRPAVGGLAFQSVAPPETEQAPVLPGDGATTATPESGPATGAPVDPATAPLTGEAPATATPPATSTPPAAQTPATTAPAAPSVPVPGAAGGAAEAPAP